MAVVSTMDQVFRGGGIPAREERRFTRAVEQGPVPEHLLPRKKQGAPEFKRGPESTPAQSLAAKDARKAEARERAEKFLRHPQPKPAAPPIPKDPPAPPLPPVVALEPSVPPRTPAGFIHRRGMVEAVIPGSIKDEHQKRLYAPIAPPAPPPVAPPPPSPLAVTATAVREALATAEDDIGAALKRKREASERMKKIQAEHAAVQAAKRAERERNPAAVALGRLGGMKGGNARAANMTPEERSEAARKAALTRYRPSEPEPEPDPWGREFGGETAKPTMRERRERLAQKKTVRSLRAIRAQAEYHAKLGTEPLREPKQLNFYLELADLAAVEAAARRAKVPRAVWLRRALKAKVKEELAEEDIL